jgi:chromosome segregation ATPase
MIWLTVSHTHTHAKMHLCSFCFLVIFSPRQTATWNETKVANATMIAQLHHEKNNLLGPKQAMLQEIEQGRPLLESVQVQLADLTQQVTSAQTLLRDRSEYEAKCQIMRAQRNELSAEKKSLVKDIETAESTLQEATAAWTEKVNTMTVQLTEFTLVVDKVDEEYPAARWEELLAKADVDDQELKDLRKKAFTEKAAIKQAHQAECAELRRLGQDVADELDKARLKKQELVATCTTTDPEADQLGVELETLNKKFCAVEAAVQELKLIAFDNNDYQEHVRKYKVLKSARKKLDAEASFDAKIASTKAELAPLLSKAELASLLSVVAAIRANRSKPTNE